MLRGRLRVSPGTTGLLRTAATFQLVVAFACFVGASTTAVTTTSTAIQPFLYGAGISSSPSSSSSSSPSSRRFNAGYPRRLSAWTKGVVAVQELTGGAVVDRSLPAACLRNWGMASHLRVVQTVRGGADAGLKSEEWNAEKAARAGLSGAAGAGSGGSPREVEAASDEGARNIFGSYTQPRHPEQRLPGFASREQELEKNFVRDTANDDGDPPTSPLSRGDLAPAPDVEVLKDMFLEEGSMAGRMSSSTSSEVLGVKGPSVARSAGGNGADAALTGGVPGGTTPSRKRRQATSTGPIKRDDDSAVDEEAASAAATVSRERARARRVTTSDSASNVLVGPNAPAGGASWISEREVTGVHSPSRCNADAAQTGGTREGLSALPPPPPPRLLQADTSSATAITSTWVTPPPALRVATEGGDETDSSDDVWLRRRGKQASSPAEEGSGFFPRAGAPPPPRGKIIILRPWGRSGASAPRQKDAGSSGMSTGGGLGREPEFVNNEHRQVVTSGISISGTQVASGNVPAPAGAGVARVAAGEGATTVTKRSVRWQPRYLTVKAVFFLFYSSLGAIMPYLPVYYHNLGIPDRQIGHLGAITPAMTFIFTPLWGALTDKSGMLKQILIFTFTTSAVLRVSLAARESYAWIVTIITLTAIMNAPVRPLLDSGALQSLDDRSEYGKQRLWGQWGFGIGSFLTGRLLSTFGFKAAFYMHAVCSVPTLLILLRFNPKKEEVNNKEPPKFGELYQLVARDPDVMVFFAMVFAIGLSSGVIENFAYKRLRELGGTGSVLGVSRLISSLAGIPMFYYAGAVTKRMSIVGVLTASMFSYIARFLIYASIKNPWAGLPAEALRGITFAGFWAASTCHVGTIAPKGLSTTMLGLLNATYGGLGQSLGSLLGGSLSARFGTARAFVVYAGVDGLLLLGFFFFRAFHPSGHQRDRGQHAPPLVSLQPASAPPYVQQQSATK